MSPSREVKMKAVSLIERGLIEFVTLSRTYRIGAPGNKYAVTIGEDHHGKKVVSCTCQYSREKGIHHFTDDECSHITSGLTQDDLIFQHAKTMKRRAHG